ncbi:MAG: glycosyltransferase [Bryobacterales bacterium]|nr:glycosyltransferase [Bryobacterales bacterium]
MKPLIKIAFASGTEDLNQRLVQRMQELYPELPLYVVAEFPPPAGEWIPYHVTRSLAENLARCRAAIREKRIRLAAVLLVPGLPYRRMRLMPLLLSPLGFLAFNENLDSFMLRPRSIPNMLRHAAWRTKNLLLWQVRPGGTVYKWAWRFCHPGELRLPFLYRGALAAGVLTAAMKSRRPGGRATAVESVSAPEGISVVIPSRNGKELLECLLPGLLRELNPYPSEVIVVDNGSEDGTAAFLSSRYPGVQVETSAAPLSFARAANRGIARARYSRVCLLNNDMVLEPGFFGPLLRAFRDVPDLFCATAQILFPPGVRREETGKAVMPPVGPEDFPVRCELPVPGEDQSYVLYGSGGCSLYCAARLRALGGLNEIYEPAYVEDLDLGYRAWLRGWPSVFAAAARVEHRHRATTSRYYSEEELSRILEVNYLRFLARAVASPPVFRKLWRQAVYRLRLACNSRALAFACRAPLVAARAPAPVESEELILALNSGEVAVFPGRRGRDQAVVLIASPYLPFPLSHGGAVRIYNLMRQAAGDYTQVLVAFCERLDTPPPELLELCAEIVLVRRTGSHSRPSTPRPEMVEEFASAAYRAALRQTLRKWRPEVVQFEFTQMAQYAGDCPEQATILVEHDITFDLYEQLVRERGDWETRRQLEKWKRFETAAWKQVSCVVTMSEKDRRSVEGARAVAIPNGVDLERFRPSERVPERARLLFIGSFAHLPNLLAIEFFLKEAWPHLRDLAPTLHIIAGQKHEYYLEHYRTRAQVELNQPGVEVEGFVSDVRDAYGRAAVVLAPLVASAGTNIKVLEAMAMGKAIVSTPAGINGLDLEGGRDLLVTVTGEEMAAAIRGLIENPEARRELERQARRTAETRYGWDAMARLQRETYASLRPKMA